MLLAIAKRYGQMAIAQWRTDRLALTPAALIAPPLDGSFVVPSLVRTWRTHAVGHSFGLAAVVGSGFHVEATCTGALNKRSRGVGRLMPLVPLTINRMVREEESHDGCW